jgi:archaeosortase A (PGF-CTERM-specific)
MDILIVISLAMMILFVVSKKRLIGALAWITFSIVWLMKVPYYMGIRDYYNVVIVTLAFIFFLLLGLTIATCNDMRVFVDVTAFSALSALVYFPFAFSDELKYALIGLVAEQTVAVGNALGFPMKKASVDVIALNSHYVHVILACTGIESIALFTGATLGIKADLARRIKAFFISAPVIYVLNLFRNVFVTASYAYSWFGDNSFYIAHNIIAKILATIALILISMAVFRILPELADLIFDLKDTMVKRWGGEC